MTEWWACGWSEEVVCNGGWIGLVVRREVVFSVKVEQVDEEKEGRLDSVDRQVE